MEPLILTGCISHKKTYREINENKQHTLRPESVIYECNDFEKQKVIEVVYKEYQ